MLRADNVSFAYTRMVSAEGGTSRLAEAAGQRRRLVPPVLNEVTADIPRGSIVGILGPNGSGKTTLLRVLNGTRQPTQGRVLLDGTPLTDLSRRAIARRMAVVPQEMHPAFEYTVLEMVLMGRHPHLGVFELEGPRDFAAARDALRATGTEDLEERRFTTLSGGEKQRVVIAAALAQSSEILLLDEPTAALDLAYQLEVASLVSQLNREREVTIVVSTHDLNFAAAICHQLVMLRVGRVIASGPTSDVLTPSNVRHLYDVDADVRVHDRTGHLIVVPITRSKDPT